MKFKNSDFLCYSRRSSEKLPATGYNPHKMGILTGYKGGYKVATLPATSKERR